MYDIVTTQMHKLSKPLDLSMFVHISQGLQHAQTSNTKNLVQVNMKNWGEY